ncbi:ketopantoate reductase family protein [Cellulosimicrobium composti]|uniref:ketopantoate reductase family protein n=1 Tax=Cellulosimicrobium composti TaxID=2672572 RepID=UPI00055606A1|nr:2-dehydropantoate 2-reductase [Cellulosimicrobium composti]TWG86807.1 2-dehydropantoate 2-reductase [Cellulosimicrobium cellulans J34]SMF11001.1 ketopantoate reductase [Cellulosimicrobium cellulans J1]
MTPSDVAVLGPGGVGGLVGALLVRSGAAVTFLASDATAAALAEHGVHVRSRQVGDLHVPARAATRLDAPVDVVLVAVKQTTLDEALDRVPPETLGDGVVVPFLNGLDHLGTLRARYGTQRVLPATIRVESTRVAPGEIEHTSTFVDVDLAPGGVAPERVEAVRALLEDAGVRTTVHADETALLWSKLAFLAPFALLTTAHRATIGEVRTTHRAELEALVREVAAVATASGAPSDPERTLAFYDRFGPEAKSSMLRDAEAGRPLETDAIGGAVVRAADRAGVDAPLTRALVERLGG